MANEKLSDKAAFPGGGSAQATDLYHSVVINDSTGSAAGTSTKQTYQQLQDGVNLLTEINDVDPDADFIPIYDTSGTATKKVHPQFANPWSIGGNQTAHYILVIGDSHGMVRINSASARNCTIPPNSSVAFPIGTEILVYRNNTGSVTLVAGSGVSIIKKSALTISARYGVARIVKVSTDGWVAYGDLD
tara:strand:- start:619 stop:1185 length:567 start_codon:yes stop_codon:yes gene_type:complete